jgi:para-nitrobenzyl esterase
VNASSVTVSIDTINITGQHSQIAENIINFKGLAYSNSDSTTRWQAGSSAALSTSDAQEYGPICPQNPTPLDALTGSLADFKQDEACLNLNIVTPDLDGAKPVMVWIHGGGFGVGANCLPSYQGDVLASTGDVVVVSINYRLGALGFLRLCDATDGAIAATGNEGLLDQINALHWIKEHIHHFGGDPNNITLFGESAGAMSIACLLAMPAAKGLFHKAILQSGAGHTFSSIEQANVVAEAFLTAAAELGFVPEHLPQLPSSEILRIHHHFMSQPHNYARFGILPFKPVIDGVDLPQPPYQAIAQGCAKDIPILSGTNSDEWTLFALLERNKDIDDNDLHTRLAAFIPAPLIPKFIELATHELEIRQIAVTNNEILTAIYTHYWFTEPCHRLLSQHSKAGGRAYRYLLRIDTVIPNLRCTHIADIGYVFGLVHPKFHGSQPRVAWVMAQIQKSWTQFAKNGDPSTADDVWPNYRPDNNSQFMAYEPVHTGVQSVEASYSMLWGSITDHALAPT